jgi:hypothetical protein
MSRLCMRCQHAAETRRPATTHRAVQGGGSNANPARHPQPRCGCGAVSEASTPRTGPRDDQHTEPDAARRAQRPARHDTLKERKQR